MAQYISVRASSWDLDGLVNQLNDKASDGWTVVSVVNTGSDIAAILTKSGSAPAVAAAPASAIAAAVEDVKPEPAVEAPAAVSEPAGWAQADTGTTSVGLGTEVGSTSTEPVSTSSYDTGWSSSATGTSSYDTGASTTSVSSDPYASSAQATTAVTQQAAVSSTPAGWYPDPSGRYELRYWDGSAWTEHVSRQGQQFTDPPVA